MGQPVHGTLYREANLKLADKSVRRLALAALSAALLIGSRDLAVAQNFTPLNAPVPSNAYIDYNGLEWAWADSTNGDAADLSYQGAFGWRVPTALELATAPLAINFLTANGNAPYNGVDAISGSYFSPELAPVYTAAMSAGACAAGYFSHYAAACDFADGDGQPFGPWAGTLPVTPDFSDQLYVRAIPTGGPGGGGPISAAPEPSTWLLMMAGLAGAGLVLRRAKPKSCVVFQAGAAA